jgi:hypothetical protein
MTLPSVLAPVRETFRAVVRAAVPMSVDLDEEAWRRGEAAVEESLSERPGSVRRQVVFFLRVLSLMGRLLKGRPLHALPAEAVRTLLARLERAPLLLLRRGVWGVRTLAFMAVYAQPGVQEALGYRASAAGWGARDGGQGTWPGRGDAGAPEPGVLSVDGEAGPGPSEEGPRG